MTAPRPDADMDELRTRAEALPDLEREVFCEAARDLLDGLEAGLATYGPFSLDDKRDMKREARHELRDGSIYLCWQRVRKAARARRGK